ncbi:MAG: hypothetical protein WBO08_14475 [Mycobacterium sp.]|nr:hypothetical protein [Mycobacterium sp.]
MSPARKAFAASMIAGAGAVATALLLSPSAVAEPAPPPAPAMPNLPFVNQLAGLPAAAPQLIQGLASAFTGGGGQSTLPVDPISPAPVASASLNLPQAPGMANALPAAATAAPAVAGVQNLVPQGLASLIPAGIPLVGLLPQTGAAVPAAAGIPAAAGVPAASPADAAAQSLVPMFLPVSALP